MLMLLIKWGRSLAGVVIPSLWMFPALFSVVSLGVTQVIVMGATNRPQDLDSAIMRRMPTRFHINQPVSAACPAPPGSRSTALGLFLQEMLPLLSWV